MGREFGKAEDGLLGSDKDTGVIDCHVSLEIIQRDCKGLIGRRECRGSGCVTLAGLPYAALVSRLTVVDDYAGDSQFLSNIRKGFDNVIWVGKVAFDVQLILCAV